MTGRFVFLGTGTSTGIPIVGCGCAVCNSSDPRNHRYRCAACIQLPTGNLLIDTPPELRLQLLRAQIKVVHAVAFTHYHADHLFGLDDVRPFPRYLGGPVPLYCTDEVEQKIRDTFSYAFEASANNAPVGYLPRLEFCRIGASPFHALGQEIVPIPLEHAHFAVLGFRLGDMAYCTDVSHIPAASWPKLQGLRVLVLDALRPQPHPGHFSVDQALDVVSRLRPAQTYFTHMGHELDHETTNRALPVGVELAYDGLAFDF